MLARRPPVSTKWTQKQTCPKALSHNLQNDTKFIPKRDITRPARLHTTSDILGSLTSQALAEGIDQDEDGDLDEDEDLSEHAEHVKNLYMCCFCLQSFNSRRKNLQISHSY